MHAPHFLLFKSSIKPEMVVLVDLLKNIQIKYFFLNCAHILSLFFYNLLPGLHKPFIVILVEDKIKCCHCLIQKGCLIVKYVSVTLTSFPLQLPQF